MVRLGLVTLLLGIDIQLASCFVNKFAFLPPSVAYETSSQQLHATKKKKKKKKVAADKPSMAQLLENPGLVVGDGPDAVAAPATEDVAEAAPAEDPVSTAEETEEIEAVAKAASEDAKAKADEDARLNAEGKARAEAEAKAEGA